MTIYDEDEYDFTQLVGRTITDAGRGNGWINPYIVLDDGSILQFAGGYGGEVVLDHEPNAAQVLADANEKFEKARRWREEHQ